MANNAPAYGSGRNRRPDPIPQIGPASADGAVDPVTVMPDGLINLDRPIVRIEGARIISHGTLWQAVGLRLHSHDPASTLFEVFLNAGGGRTLVIAVQDEDEAVATWRSAGKAMQVPLLLEAADGTASYPYPQIGGVALGQFHYRRQHSFLRHRRPRFLVRRKAARQCLEKIAVRGAEMSRGHVR
ncbi:MAG: DUF6101 family protein [Bosea sp. (in: a-proteobacteria)]